MAVSRVQGQGVGLNVPRVQGSSSTGATYSRPSFRDFSHSSHFHCRRCCRRCSLVQPRTKKVSVIRITITSREWKERNKQNATSASLRSMKRTKNLPSTPLPSFALRLSRASAFSQPRRQQRPPALVPSHQRLERRNRQKTRRNGSSKANDDLLGARGSTRAGTGGSGGRGGGSGRGDGARGGRGSGGEGGADGSREGGNGGGRSGRNGGTVEGEEE
jgi:hypothetical protein